MIGTSHFDLSYLIRDQRPAREFLADAQPADRGNGLVVNYGSPSSLDDVKQMLDERVICGEDGDARAEAKRLLDEFFMCESEREEDVAMQMLDELSMRRVECGIVHDWEPGESPTESVCRRCGLGVDEVHNSALVFSEESCRIPWSEWRAGVRDMTDEELLTAMVDADVASLTHGREAWIDSTRPKYAVIGEHSVLRREIERRGLEWPNRAGYMECFLDSVRRKSPTA